MSTYYAYQEVGVKIAHRLFKTDGWKVYGYHADNSDMMTDYWDPAYWSGIAEKNGYTFVFNCSSAAKERTERIWKDNISSTTSSISASIAEKIKKLERMTVANGASEQEEESAKNSIKKLMEKAKSEQEKQEENYEIITIPGHLANPPRCNWHVEKNGIIIEKGTGMLKFRSVPDITKEREQKEWQDYNNLSEDEWKKSVMHDYMRRWNRTEEEAARYAERAYTDAKEGYALLEKFNGFISKINSVCGGMVGNENESYTYEKVKVTKYKKENKAKEKESGKVEEGQCFILKSNFSHGCRKGLVYRIHASEYNGKIYYSAYKLNGKLTKECHGRATDSNTWYIGSTPELLTKWINRGNIAWCEIVEEDVQYEVEKVVKKKKNSGKSAEAEEKTADKETTRKTEKEEKTEAPDVENVENLTYEIKEDVHTKTGEKIYVVKIMENLSREQYKEVNEQMKSLGGYYSRFKHGFVFKENPAEKLNLENVENAEQKIDQSNKQTPEEPGTESRTEKINEMEIKKDKDKIEFEITEDIHTKTKERLWIVKPKEKLEKAAFMDIKQRFAVIHGYYSGFMNGFVFKYDPTENLASTG